jgi:hypothetical protein
MSAISTPVNRAAARPGVSRSVLLAIAMIAIVVALTLFLVDALASPGGASAGYDAPFYSQYLQEISAGW